MKRLFVGISVVFALVIGSWSLGIEDCYAIPQRTNYQGKLTDASGNLVSDGNYNMRFSIYDAETGGTQEWTETWESGTSQVQVTNGLFNVLLGTHTPLNLPFDEDYWLEVGVYNAGSSLWETLSPRQQIVSVGYAYRSESANDALKLSGQEASYYLDAANIAGTISESQIDPDMATDSEVQDLATQVSSQSWDNKVTTAQVAMKADSALDASVNDLNKGFIDVFSDGTGIDSGQSSGYEYDTVNKEVDVLPDTGQKTWTSDDDWESGTETNVNHTVVADQIQLDSEPGMEIDYMEYATDGAAQAAYVSSDAQALPTSEYSSDSYTKLLLHCNGTDGSATFTDSGDTGHTVTRHGNAQIDTAQKKFGTASGLFDGNGDYLSIPNSADWNFGTGDFTIDFWVKRKSLTGGAYNQQAILGQHIGSSNGNPRNVIYFQSGNLWLYDWGEDISNVSTGSIDDTADWHHVALVRSSGTATWYIDGMSGGSFSYPSASDNSNPLYIGYGRASNGGELYLNAYLDEVRISKGIARWTSDFDVANLQCYSEDTIKQQGSYSLKAIAKQTGSLNDTLTREVGPPTSEYSSDADTKLLLHLNNNVTDSGDTVHTVTNNGMTFDAGTKKFGSQSGYFNGSEHDYLTVPDHADWDFGTGDFTIDCWVYFTGSAIYVTHGVDESWWAMYGGGNLNWFREGVGNIQFGSDGALTGNTWHHIAVVRSSGVIYGFVNGVLKDSVADTTDYGNYTGTLKIGVDTFWTPTYYTGYIDEVRVSKGVARWTSDFTPIDLSDKEGIKLDVFASRTGTNLQAQLYDEGVVDSDTKLLLHCNGADASTTFTDDGDTGHTVTALNGAEVDTTQKEFGTGSLYLPDTASRLSVPSHADFNFGALDFTIDFWIRFYDLDPTPYASYIFRRYQDGSNTFVISKGPSASGNKLYMYFSWDATDANPGGMSGTWAPNLNQWYHLAFERYGAIPLIFIDGVSQAVVNPTAFSGKTIGDLTADLYIGNNESGIRLTGAWMDEIRISKGIARWTSNFTPSPREYPYNLHTKDISITSAGGWETTTWDISGVANADKDAISNIVFKITNADVDNTFYIDNMRTVAYKSSGTWESGAYTPGGGSRNWYSATVSKTEPSGTSSTVEYSQDGSAWDSAIENVPDSESIYVKATLSSDQSDTPSIQDIEVEWELISEATVVSTAHTASSDPSKIMVVANYTGTINFYVSRDGGTTWTAAAANTPVAVSGQPSGTDIRVKAVYSSPAVLEDWSVWWE